ncbi:MAG: GMP synthase [Desulfobulbaceae bacterium]|nr:GMP synthase [Desulfobulbaceae bacterium]
MRVAILQCDEVLEKFQPEFGSYVGMIEQMFASVDGVFEFDSFDCREQQYPDDLDRYDFFITTGSRASVYEENPWIHNLIDFVRRLANEKKKFIGICFGHQILAMAFKARVEKSEKGWGIGIATNHIVSTPHWMGKKKKILNIIVNHQDQVVSLPEGARVIAESDFCPFFIVQWNEHFLSIQGHPEWNRAYSKALINERRTIISSYIVDTGFRSLATKPDNDCFIRWIIDFVNS